MSEITPYDEGDREGKLSRLTRDEIKELVDAFWAGKSPRTIKAYKEDLLRIADWQGLSTIDDLARRFLGRGPGKANLLAERFIGWATKKKHWAPAYVNNHLAALRSVVRFARKAGRITWALDVSDVKAEKYVDTRGPGLEGMVATLQQAQAAQPPARAARDVAILSLFALRGLRRDEIVTLDLEHVDTPGRRLFVLRKKRKQRKWVTIPSFCVAALGTWIGLRGPAPGPLFLSMGVATNAEKPGKRRPDGRLAESSVWWLVKHYALKAGVPKKQARPHGFRHAAITEVLDLTDGNVRGAQAFGDHSSPATTMAYDDNRRDVAGEMADLLARRFEDALKRRERGASP